MTSPKTCTKCVHYSYHEDTDTDGYFVCSWAECAKRPTLANLRQFPFKKTNCAAYEAAKEGGK